MTNINYLNFEEINPDDFIPLMNNQNNRKHLIEHDFFTSETIKAWVNSKIEVDATKGCKVRAIVSENELLGWCAIQAEDGKYEIAIIIDDKFWGLGKNIFKEMMKWVKELGHNEVFIHFLHTRPHYKFLKKIAKNVYETELLNNKFITYELRVK